MRRRHVLLLLAPVAALSFGLGWFLRPGLRIAAFPEAGELTPIPRPCSRVGVSLRELGVFSDQALGYFPGDSARTEAVSFRRQGTDARVLVVKAGMPDDEVDAEVMAYDLQWKPEAGWVVVNCAWAARRDGVGALSPRRGARRPHPHPPLPPAHGFAVLVGRGGYFWATTAEGRGGTAPTSAARPGG